MKKIFFALAIVLLVLSGCSQPPQPSPDPLEPQPQVNEQPIEQEPQEPIVEEPTTGSLSVTLVTPDNVLVENGVVEIFVDDEKIATQTTNANGVAVFEDLPLGVEWYLSAADLQNEFQAVAGEIEEPESSNELSMQLLLREEPAPVAEPESSTIILKLESDDDGFYVIDCELELFKEDCESGVLKVGDKVTELFVPTQSTINMTIIQRSTNSAFGGADVKTSSNVFAKFNVPNSQERTIEFTMPSSSISVSSYWPSSSIFKSSFKLSVE